jgi:hypothetical protein
VNCTVKLATGHLFLAGGRNEGIEEGSNRAEGRQKVTIRHLSQEPVQISLTSLPFQALRCLLS